MAVPSDPFIQYTEYKIHHIYCHSLALQPSTHIHAHINLPNVEKGISCGTAMDVTTFQITAKRVHIECQADENVELYLYLVRIQSTVKVVCV